MTLLKIMIIFLFILKITSMDRRKDMLAKMELEVYIEQKKHEINPRYKLHYHITPPVGWMNGPNGFSFYNNEYHLFYQFYPYDTQWGPMHWGHVVSSNLVDWRQLPTALIPKKEQCFAGSAVVSNGIMVVIYTGHERSDRPPFYNESQYLAFSIDGVNFQKYKGNPLMLRPPFPTQDFRDPKVWKYKNFWYLVLGSKNVEQKGVVLLYRSTNLITWKYLNILAESNGDFGSMWEYPDFFELNGKFILLISPHGVAPQGDRYRNTFQTGYIMGNFDYESYEFVQEAGFQELDFGHDFYATQTIEKDGKRYMIAWFGMWEASHPEDADGWVGAMTTCRELDLIGSRILMKPVDAITKLRGAIIMEGLFRPNSSIEFEKTAEIIISVDVGEFIDFEIKGSKGGDKIRLRWNAENGKVMVDRSGDIRQVGWEPIDMVMWRIFVDASSLELFCGEGEVVFSSRAYPKGDWRVTNCGPLPIHVTAYSLTKSMPE